MRERRASESNRRRAWNASRPRNRVEAKRDVASHVVSYLVANSLLIEVRTVAGAAYFWPTWVPAR
jgi:hypothetical protein